MNKLKEIATAIGAVFVGLLGLLWFFKASDKTAEVLADNAKVKEELAKADVKIEENKASLAGEEIKRNQLKEDIKKEQNDSETPSDVLDFFNKRK